jgi:choline transport protein
LFVFPPELPVTGESMNYAIVVFAIVCIISGLTWIFDGRKNYTGPRVEEGLEEVVAERQRSVASSKDTGAKE